MHVLCDLDGGAASPNRRPPLLLLRYLQPGGDGAERFMAVVERRGWRLGAGGGYSMVGVFPQIFVSAKSTRTEDDERCKNGRSLASHMLFKT